MTIPALQVRTIGYCSSDFHQEDLGLVLTRTHGFMPFHCLPGLDTRTSDNEDVGRGSLDKE